MHRPLLQVLWMTLTSSRCFKTGCFCAACITRLKLVSSPDMHVGRHLPHRIESPSCLVVVSLRKRVCTTVCICSYRVDDDSEHLADTAVFS